MFGTPYVRCRRRSHTWLALLLHNMDASADSVPQRMLVSEDVKAGMVIDLPQVANVYELFLS
jgi:hypothetical protein